MITYRGLPVIVIKSYDRNGATYLEAIGPPDFPFWRVIAHECEFKEDVENAENDN